MVIDADPQGIVADLRQDRNRSVVGKFQWSSKIFAVYLHYLVPRIAETTSWMIDETVEKFGPGGEDMPVYSVFDGATPLDNELPAWKQRTPRST